MSKAGLPIQSLVMPFIAKLFDKESPSEVPLGRWKVNSCDDVLNGDKANAYDNCSTSSEMEVKTSVFFNSKLPDGDVPDMSKAGLPLQSLVMPFVSKLFDKQLTSSAELPLGRWKVNSCDEVLHGDKANAYDNCSTTSQMEVKRAVSYNSALPDGDVPDVSKEGLPLKALVMPFVSKMFDKETSVELPLGRWKVNSCDDVLTTKKSAGSAYDHSA